MKVSAAGGKPEAIGDAHGYGVGGAWNRKGEILFAPVFGEGLFRVAAAGGDPVRVTSLDARQHETLHCYPLFLPDDEHFLFLLHTVSENANEIHVGSMRGGAHKFVVKADSIGGFRDGQLLFVRDGVLYAQPFDVKKLAAAGDPQKVLDDVAYAEEWVTAHVTVSNDGAIVYPPVSNAVRAEVGWYDEGGKLLQKLFEETNVGAMSLAPDDSRVLLERRDPRKGANDVYVYDIARGVMTRVTGGLSENNVGVFSHDGSRVYFTSDRFGMYDVFSQSDDGVGAAQTLIKSAADKHVCDIAPDGTALLLEVVSGATKPDIWIAPLNGGAPRPWIISDAYDQEAQFSPDGRWVTYRSDRSGRFEAYVAAYPNGRSIQVSTDGGRGPQFDSDGTHIVFTNAQRVICSTEVHPNGSTLTIGRPQPLFQQPKTMLGWWCSRTAKRFLCAVAADPRDLVPVFNYVRGGLR
jgi:hypothetical protein